MWMTVNIVLFRASEDNDLSGVVTCFCRDFEWLETGFGRTTCSLGEVTALELLHGHVIFILNSATS